MRHISAALLILICSIAFSQNYRYPLDLPISTSANFGELRPNHFHSGLDLRVGGVSGANVYAPEEGFVSRISISSTGYGNAMYIDHPNGQSTVYGHLHAYAGKIAEYVKNYQYKNKKFSINVYLDSTDLQVKKGDLIAYAGNTGTSFGAHLHFEIRESQKQIPVNAFTKGYFTINDNVAPIFHQIGIFTLDSLNDTQRSRLLKAEKTIKTANGFSPQKTKVFEVCNPVFIGVSANDYLPANNSKQGLNVMKVFLDKELIFTYTMNEFEFSETGFINSLVDYQQLKSNKIHYIKTYVEEGNRLKVYSGVKNKGLIHLKDTLAHDISVEAFDDKGNKSVLKFKIKKSKKVETKHQVLNPAQYLTVKTHEPFEYYAEGLKVSIPSDALFSDCIFSAKKDADKTYSALWSIGNEKNPLIKKITLALQANVPSDLRAKVLIAKQNENGKIAYCGGTMDNSYIIADVGEFGSYFVTVDTIAPQVTLKPKQGKTKTASNDYRNQSKIGVIISDNLSGISKYDGYIDDAWVLFEYDAKSRSLEYTFDDKITKGKKHTLKVTVADNRSNSKTLTTEFLY